MRAMIAVALLSCLVAGCAGPVENTENVTTVASEQGFKHEPGELEFCGLTRIEQPKHDVTLWIYVGPQGKMAIVAQNTKTGQLVASSSMNREDAEKIVRLGLGEKANKETEK